MDLNDRNRINGFLSFSIGILIIVFLIPVFISLISYNNILYYFLDYTGYLFLDLFILAIMLFLYTYFKLRPIKTLKGKKNLTIIVMIFGGILIVLPLIGISLLISSFLDYYLDGFLLFYLIALIPLLMLLIPGIYLFIYGWSLRKNHRIENNY